MEFQPGAFGLHGFRVDLRGLRKGTYPMKHVVWYGSAPFARGDQVKYLNEHDHPIRVNATKGPVDQ